MITYNRRTFLSLAMATLGLAWADRLFAWPILKNPCLDAAAVPNDSPWLQHIWDGLNLEDVWDSHCHVAGLGDSQGAAASGIVLGRGMRQPLSHPWQYFRRDFIMNASCATMPAYRAEGLSVDEGYVRRLTELMAAMPTGFKTLLLAFDYPHDEAGRPLPEKCSFYVPDDYAMRVTAANPDRFVWAASIHPYRPDALDRLRQAKADGAKAVKWIPQAQNIVPDSPKCDAFYRELARLRLPLLCHTGEEKALFGVGEQDFANPLRLRRALDAGVTVIAAHCAITGQHLDHDHGDKRIDGYRLFARVMEESLGASAGSGLFYGDISAVTLVIKKTEYLRELLTRDDWAHRLINGSDYPLPGIIPLISLTKLASDGLLPKEAIADLDLVRSHNPILFDFAVKRALSWQGKKFAAKIFESRRVFT